MLKGFSTYIKPCFPYKFYTRASDIHVTCCACKSISIITKWLMSRLFGIMLRLASGLASPQPVSTAYSNGKGGRRGKKEENEGKLL